MPLASGLHVSVSEARPAELQPHQQRLLLTKRALKWPASARELLAVHQQAAPAAWQAAARPLPAVVLQQ